MLRNAQIFLGRKRAEGRKAEGKGRRKAAGKARKSGRGTRREAHADETTLKSTQMVVGNRHGHGDKQHGSGAVLQHGAFEFVAAKRFDSVIKGDWRPSIRFDVSGHSIAWAFYCLLLLQPPLAAGQAQSHPAAGTCRTDPPLTSHLHPSPFSASYSVHVCNPHHPLSPSLTLSVLRPVSDNRARCAAGSDRLPPIFWTTSRLLNLTRATATVILHRLVQSRIPPLIRLQLWERPC
ncbi:hypothetical protein ANO11243_061060 [Dothideomycetidae sp. 11243]|nr:hypothetical protein ANO11243_061060 [fungal sp. No.11243]